MATRPLALRFFVFALLGFATYGAVAGSLQVLLVDLVQALTLTPASLGIAMTIGSIGSLPVMAFGGRWGDRFGMQKLLAVGAFALAALLVGFSQVASYPVLAALFVAFACASGAFDVGINAASILAEQRSGQKLIVYCHAAFSALAALSALLTGLLLSSGVSFRALYLGTASLCALYACAVLLARPLPREVDNTVKSIGRGQSLFRNPALLSLGLIVALGSISESSLETWSAIYLREIMGLSALVGASGVAAYHAAMFFGRVLTGRLQRNVARRTLLVGAGLLGVAGMTLALWTQQSGFVLTGFFIVGFAFSGVAPLGFSVAGDRAEGRAGEASSVMTLISYGGFLVAPSLIGLLAAAFGLRAALGTVVVCGLLLALLSSRIERE